MKVCVSARIPEKQRIFHKSGCMYEQRMNPVNRQTMEEEKAERLGYRPCSCCSGLKGEIHAHRSEIDRWKKKDGLRMVIYDKMTDIVYLTTGIGAWKIFVDRYGNYCLYHKNRYRDSMSVQEIKNGQYHLQSDVKTGSSFVKIARYILEHDKAKVIIMDDYRKLPKMTKKQKKYYKQAEQRAKKRERRQNRNRLDRIFAALEKENPELKQYSMC